MILTTGVLLAVVAITTAVLIGHRCRVASGKISNILTDELGAQPATVPQPSGNQRAHSHRSTSGHGRNTSTGMAAITAAGRTGTRHHARRG